MDITSLPGQLIDNLLNNLHIVAIFVGFYLFVYLAGRRAVRFGLSKDKIDDLSYWIGFAAVVGGRVVYILPEAEVYVDNPYNLILVNTGMNLYGAIGGALIVGIWKAKRLGLELGPTLDLYAVYLPVGLLVARFGCVLGNSCFGEATTGPFGVVFPGLTQARFPSELYEGLFVLLLFGVLMVLSTRRLPAGLLFLAFLTAYPIGRTLVDFTRIDLGGGMSDVALPFSLLLSSVAAAMVFVHMNGGLERLMVRVRRRPS
jgi:phosphatidylglycerol:prolipoprotein diacylglycerol transferase